MKFSQYVWIYRISNRDLELLDWCFCVKFQLNLNFRFWSSEIDENLLIDFKFTSWDAITCFYSNSHHRTNQITIETPKNKRKIWNTAEDKMSRLTSISSRIEVNMQQATKHRNKSYWLRDLIILFTKYLSMKLSLNISIHRLLFICGLL